MSSLSDSFPSASGNVLVPRLSLTGMETAMTPFSKPRKMSRQMSTASLTGTGSLGSPQSDQMTSPGRKMSRSGSMQFMSRSGSMQFSRRLSHPQGPNGKGSGLENGKTSSVSSRSTLPALPETRRMNLSDVIIWRRLTKTLRQRVAERKQEKPTFCWLDRSLSRSVMMGSPQTRYEPTYRMEPSYKLCETKCQNVVTEYLAQKLKDVTYEPESCGEMSKLFTDEIRQKIKARHILPPRYKCIVYVVLGEKKNQGVRVSSQFQWNEDTDSYISASYQNGSIFCVVTVFAVYME